MTALTNKLFIALPAPSVISQALRQLRLLNKGLSGVRWVSEENLHITVFFLGFVEAVHITAIKAVMDKCLQGATEFTLQLQGITLEGARLNHPSMVWARFEKNIHFTQLAGEIGLGVSHYLAEPSKFPDPIPHITLARIKHAPLPDVNVSLQCAIEFNGYELWRSLPVPGGVIYEKL